jgi:hypothetical protein
MSLKGCLKEHSSCLSSIRWVTKKHIQMLGDLQGIGMWNTNTLQRNRSIDHRAREIPTDTSLG